MMYNIITTFHLSHQNGLRCYSPTAHPPHGQRGGGAATRKARTEEEKKSGDEDLKFHFHERYFLLTF